jgi:hypothetical protein
MSSVYNPRDRLKLPKWAQEGIEWLLGQIQVLEKQAGLSPDSDTIVLLSNLEPGPRGEIRISLGNGVTVEFGGTYRVNYRADEETVSVRRWPPNLSESLTIVPFSHRRVIIGKRKA